MSAKHLQCLLVGQDVVEQFSYTNVFELNQFEFLFNELISICKTLSEIRITGMFVCF